MTEVSALLVDEEGGWIETAIEGRQPLPHEVYIHLT